MFLVFCKKSVKAHFRGIYTKFIPLVFMTNNNNNLLYLGNIRKIEDKSFHLSFSPFLIKT